MTSGSMKEYKVVRLNKENISDLTRLHTEVYKVLPPQGYFSKKYDTAYTGIEYTGFLAYNLHNLPVAYYGVIPCFLQYDNKVFLAAQSADTMTHPQHRFKGMFVELSIITFDLCRELGIRLIFGFPNQQSYHGAINKLGWQMTETMDGFIIPAGGIPFATFANRFGFLKKPYRKYVKYILGKYRTPSKGVTNSVVRDGYGGLLRNDQYLQYKSYSPASVIEVAGAKAWIRVKQSLLIGDMESVNEDNFGKAVARIRSIAVKLGLKQVQFHCSPGTKLHSLFGSQFKPIPSYPVLFQDFGSPVSPQKIKFTLADIDIF